MIDTSINMIGALLAMLDMISFWESISLTHQLLRMIDMCVALGCFFKHIIYTHHRPENIFFKRSKSKGAVGWNYTNPRSIKMHVRSRQQTQGESKQTTSKAFKSILFRFCLVHMREERKTSWILNSDSFKMCFSYQDLKHHVIHIVQPTRPIKNTI